MSVFDAVGMIVAGAGVSSIIWSWMAWRETYQWMELVDRCICNMERMRLEIDELKEAARAAGGGE